MSDVFLLGAGFSTAISSFMPLTKQLGESVLDTLRSLHRGKLGLERHSSICNGLSCDGSLDLPNTDFEQVLSSLSEPQPYLLPPENDRRHALFTELIGHVATTIEMAVDSATSSEPPAWLLNLITTWHTRRVDVITFNYDTLVESAFEYAADCKLIAPQDSQPLNHRSIGPSVIPWWVADISGERRRPPGDTFRYYKLHGSTDWFWDDLTQAADSMIQIGLRKVYGELQPRYSEEERKYRAVGKTPLIVPPTTTKSGYFMNPAIRHVWHQAYHALYGAQRVFVIGYSLPPADTLVRSMLTSALSQAEVFVVDPDDQIGKRYDDLNARCLDLQFCKPGLEMSEVADHYKGLPSL